MAIFEWHTLFNELQVTLTEDIDINEIRGTVQMSAGKSNIYDTIHHMALYFNVIQGETH